MLKREIGKKNMNSIKKAMEKMSMTRNEERLYQWVIKNKRELERTQWDKTYWQQREASRNGIIEYRVETLKEMQDCLEKTGIDKNLALIFSAEAMKWKMQFFKAKEVDLKLEGSRLPSDKSIPEFVYTI